AQSNAWLSPLAHAKPKRPLRDAALLGGRAGTIMLVERMRLNTQKLTCVRLPQPALSNSWWPFALRKGGDLGEKALALWLNSTLGILTFVAHRSPTEGPWVKFKKPSLSAVPVLDISQLTRMQLQHLGAAYDRLSIRPLGI